MRVLFVTVPWRTHYHAMVPLGWAFRAAGHEVRVASGPALADEIAHSGLPAVVTGGDFDFLPLFRRQNEPLYDLDWSAQAAEDVERRTIEMLEIFARISEALVDDLVAFARSWRPDLVVYEPTMVAGALVAEVLGVPAVRHLWGPDITYSTDGLQPQVLEPMLSRFGLTSLETLGTVTIDIAPASMQVDATFARQPMRYVPYNGPGVMPRWLVEPPARPRVCVTWGTSMVHVGGRRVVLLDDAVRALAGLDVELVVAVAADQRDLLGDVPDGARVVESVPLHLLLPDCAAVVHHGGSGTTLTATVSGTPQVVVAKSPDQVVNAVHVDASGAGMMLLPRGDGIEAIRAGIRQRTERLLDGPGFAETAQALRDEVLARPSPAQVVGTLAALAREHAPA